MSSVIHISQEHAWSLSVVTGALSVVVLNGILSSTFYKYVYTEYLVTASSEI
jgi:hypothetical protein